MMSPPLLVFDLDGTLIDTAPDLVETLNVIFAREGLPPVPFAKARKLIGGGARAMIVRGVEAESRLLSATQIERLFDEFIAYYTEHIADRSRPFPGLTETLDTLAQQGHRFAVCTNKLERLSVRLLQQLDLASRFAVICGQDTFGVQKPDPDALRRTILAAGGSPERAILIGDSETDVRTAKSAGIPIVAVDFGYTEWPVAEFQPDRIISHFTELPSALAAPLQ
jgi:phosphoglycolate phosphatase